MKKNFNTRYIYEQENNDDAIVSFIFINNVGTR